MQLWKSGIRQNRLAKLLDIDETILSRIMNGFRHPSPEIQEKIATLLHADPVWLFAYEPDSLATTADKGFTAPNPENS